MRDGYGTQESAGNWISTRAEAGEKFKKESLFFYFFTAYDTLKNMKPLKFSTNFYMRGNENLSSG